MLFPQLGFGFWMVGIGLDGVYLTDPETSSLSDVNALGAPIGMDGILVILVDKDCLDITLTYARTTRDTIACDPKSHTTSL